MDSQGHSKKRPVYRIAGAEQSVARETGIYCVPLGRDCHLFRPRRKRDCTGSVQVPMTTPAAATPSASPCGWLDASLARDSRTNTAGTAPRVSAFAARESRIWESRLFVLFAVAKRDGSPNRNGTVIFYVPDGEGTVPAVFGRQAPRLLPPRHPHHPADGSTPPSPGTREPILPGQPRASPRLPLGKAESGNRACLCCLRWPSATAVPIGTGLSSSTSQTEKGLYRQCSDAKRHGCCRHAIRITLHQGPTLPTPGPRL